MKRLEFNISIDADLDRVFDTMIGKDSFKIWTSVFDPSSDFEGSWEKNDKVYFTCFNNEGKKAGIIGRVEENNPSSFISVKYIGVLYDGQEVYDGPKTLGWTGVYENYRFSKENNLVKVTVEIDSNDEMEQFYRKNYSLALQKLKEICEK